MFKVYKKDSGDYLAINKTTGEYFATEHWHVFQQELKARLDRETVVSGETETRGEISKRGADKENV